MGCGQVEQAERGLRGADEVDWAGTLERYFGDLRAAHAWLADQDPELSLRMAEALASASFGAVYRGDLAAARTAVRRALAAAQGLAPIRARRPLEALGEVAVFRGDLAEAADFYTRAYALSISNGDVLDAAWDAASAATAYAYGDRPVEASRLADQRRLRQSSAARRRRWPSSPGSAVRSPPTLVPARLGTTCSERSPWPRLRGRRFVAGIARVSLASLDARHGDIAVALDHYERVIREWQQAGAWTPMWVTLRTLVGLVARAGAWADAATLYGAVTAASSGAPPFGADADRLRQSAARLLRRLTVTGFVAASEKASR